MQSIIIKSFAIYIAFMSLVYANDINLQNKGDDTFPHHVLVEYNDEKLDLSLTGLTVRKKFFLKIYSMAHYIEQKSDITESEIPEDKIYENIIEQNATKQISMVFMRDLKADQIQESLKSGIKLNTSEEEYLQIQEQLEAFIYPISEDIKENDEFILRWFSNDTVISIFQGQEISSIESETFARALWSIWFGKRSVVKRKSLIEQLLTSS